jgi:hypothetical protein
VSSAAHTVVTHKTARHMAAKRSINFFIAMILLDSAVVAATFCWIPSKPEMDRLTDWAITRVCNPHEGYSILRGGAEWREIYHKNRGRRTRTPQLTIS